MTDFASQPVDPICQSCSMPMQQPSDFGTEAGGSHSEDYCKYCYQEGAFTDDQTLEQMIEISAPKMAKAIGASEQEALVQLQQILSGLKRWRAVA